MRKLRVSHAVPTVVAAALLAACGSSDEPAAEEPAMASTAVASDATMSSDTAVVSETAMSSDTTVPTDDHDDHDHEDDDDHDREDDDAGEPVEIGGTRVVATYDGGLHILDGTNLDLVADVEIDGFNRLNPAGDDRHVLVSHGDEFLVLDSGVAAEEHGDHFHYYGYEPSLSELELPAEKAGHVTHHHGTTALFADGTGDITLFDPYELITGNVESVTVASEEAHHGVAVQLADGALFASVGTEDGRTGARVLDRAGDEIARTDECPGLHGETTVAPTGGGDVVVAGCEDGVIIYSEGEFSKVASPDEYGRIGTLKGTDTSPIALGDYKVDPDAELERPTRISLTNTETGTLQLVDLDSSYSWRSLVRDHEDNAMVLTTDGDLTVIDAASGEIITEIPVVEPWKEPLDWQQPRPAIAVDGATAYVTEPESNLIHLVDLDADEVVETAELPATPNEVTTP